MGCVERKSPSPFALKGLHRLKQSRTTPSPEGGQGVGGRVEKLQRNPYLCLNSH